MQHALFFRIAWQRRNGQSALRSSAFQSALELLGEAGSFLHSFFASLGRARGFFLCFARLPPFFDLLVKLPPADLGSLFHRQMLRILRPASFCFLIGLTA